MSGPFSSSHFRSSAPKIIRILLTTIVTLSLGAAVIPPLSLYLGLSKMGIAHFFLWQWISYGLFEPSRGHLSFSLLLQVGFTCYMLWIFGSSLIDRFGVKRFAYLFFGSTFVGGLCAYATLSALHLPYVIASVSPPLYACLIAWAKLNSHARVFLFFAIPFRADRAIYVLIGITLLSHLADQNWPMLAALLANLGCGFLFTWATTKITYAFSWRRMMQWTLMRCKHTLLRWTHKRSSQKKSSHKIYDIHSGKPRLNDEEFMDAMLQRISRYGEQSLSFEEKQRMREIASKRK